MLASTGLLRFATVAQYHNSVKVNVKPNPVGSVTANLPPPPRAQICHEEFDPVWGDQI